jgi:hypothetical protein
MDICYLESCVIIIVQLGLNLSNCRLQFVTLVRCVSYVGMFMLLRCTAMNIQANGTNVSVCLGLP